jgi:hypothetical protein
MSRRKTGRADGTGAAPSPGYVLPPPAAPREEVPGTLTVAFNDPFGIVFDLPGGRRLRINGNAVSLRGREMAGPLPAGAFGFTFGVDAGDWEYVSRTYGGLAAFRDGRLFATEREGHAKAAAREREGLRHGYEPRPAGLEEG